MKYNVESMYGLDPYFWDNKHLDQEDYVDFREGVEDYLQKIGKFDRHARDVPHGLLINKGEAVFQLLMDVRVKSKGHEDFCGKMKAFFNELVPYEIYSLWVYFDLKAGWYNLDPLFVMARSLSMKVEYDHANDNSP